jgi:hypothetical protein
MTVRRSVPFVSVVAKALKMAEPSICMDFGDGKETDLDCSATGRDYDAHPSNRGGF